YTMTRHNLGFMVVDSIAETLHEKFQPARGEFWTAFCSFKNFEIALVKPVTFMNNSGIAVADFIEQNTIDIDHVLIICDDFQLPLGTLRLRPYGSDGGHRGLASVIYHLGSDQFPRLRCGIGSELIPVEKSSLSDFVLEPFPESEHERVVSLVERARDAAVSFVENGIERTMSRFNAGEEECSN
ncbi:MAG: aminoacyl-tRNA hydrolase, partial [Bacteroidota bacterium]